MNLGPLNYAGGETETPDVADDGGDGFGSNSLPHVPIVLGVVTVLALSLMLAVVVLSLFEG
ncbi:MAG: hypothetical protein JWQ20_4571 [Conexibacter sp.]|nr:hypothetical protein [Conexibacter sp.]